MSTLFRLQFIGNIGRDAEVKTLESSGRTLINFTVAVTEKYKPKSGEQKSETTWIQVTKWIAPNGSTKLADYLKKGQLVLVEGKASARAYNNPEGAAKASLECNADNIQLLGKSDGGSSSNAAYNDPEDMSAPGNSTDDLPF